MKVSNKAVKECACNFCGILETGGRFVVNNFFVNFQVSNSPYIIKLFRNGIK